MFYTAVFATFIPVGAFLSAFALFIYYWVAKV